MDKKLQKQLRQLREAGEADKRFDVNLQEGKVAEELIEKIFRGKETVEVKRDFMVSHTGNIAIEYMYRGQPSGILTSEAGWYAFVLSGEQYDDDLIVFITRNRLMRLIQTGKYKIVKGGDNGKSEMMLIPVRDLLTRESEL